MRRRDWLAGTVATALAGAPSSRFIKGIVWAAFPKEASYIECIAQAAAAGFQAIELRVIPGGELSPASTVDDARRIAEAARRHHIDIASLWALTPSSPSLVSPDEEVRRQAFGLARKAIELAPALGCESVLVTAGVLGRGSRMEVTYDTAWQRATSAYRELLPLADAAGVTLTPENVWSKFLVSSRDMRDFVDQFHSPRLKVHFDVGNVMQYGFPEDWILALNSRIHRVHLKDYKLAAGGQQGRFVPLLEGDVQWKDVVACLVKTGYRGYVTAEVGTGGDDPEYLLKISRALDRILNMV